MAEMVHTGFMHNHMRMYWAKQILRWSPTPEIAFERTLHLNNRHFLPGWARRQLLCQRGLDLRPPRPAVARAGDLRQRALDDRGRPGAEVRHGVLPLSRGSPGGRRKRVIPPSAGRRRSHARMRHPLEAARIVAQRSDALHDRCVRRRRQCRRSTKDPEIAAARLADHGPSVVGIEVDHPVVGCERPEERHAELGRRRRIRHLRIAFGALTLAVEGPLEPRVEHADRAVLTVHSSRLSGPTISGACGSWPHRRCASSIPSTTCAA